MNSPTPSPIVSEIAKAKPKLVIFDDDAILLARFTRQYSKLGYEVVPVIVANPVRETEEGLYKDGRIVQGASAQPGLYDEPKHKDPVFDVASLLAHAQEVYKYNSTADHKEDVDWYAAMQGIEFGIKTKTELRNILKDLKPDCVLSDLSMRRWGDYDDKTPDERMADDETIMGDQVMAIAKEIVPAAKRAVHSGNYTQLPTVRRVLNETNAAKLREHQPVATENGYLLLPKDAPQRMDTARLVHGYFAGHASLAETVATYEQKACSAGVVGL